MSRLFFLLSLKPIVYGLIGMIVSGVSFPLAGVIILRNGLIPMRYMLMHGIILGGILSVASGLPLIPTVSVLNIVLVFILSHVNKKTSLSSASTAMMVITMGLASMLSQLFDVPAKDTLEILWGSPFALVKGDLFILAGLALILIIYIVLCFRPLSMLFFDREIAFSCGINIHFHNNLMLLVTALVLSIAMKLLGALLIDALVVLPVLAASSNVRSLKSMFIRSSLTGLFLSVAGYFAALAANLPVSGILALLSGTVYLFTYILKKIRWSSRGEKQ